MPAITRHKAKLADLNISLEDTLLFQHREEDLKKQIRSLQRRLRASERELSEERARRQPASKRGSVKRSVSPGTTKTTSGRVTKRGTSKGMSNPGVWCYRNAILQCLLNQPKYCELLQQIHTDCDKGVKKCVSCSLKDMAETYWSAKCKEDPHKTIGRNLQKALLECIPEDDVPIGGDIHQGIQTCTMSFFRNAVLRQLCGGDLWAVNSETALINPVFRVDTVTQYTCKFSGKDSDPVTDNGFGIDVTVQDTEMARGLPMMDYLRQKYFTLKINSSCGCQGCKDNFIIGKTTVGNEERLKPEQTQRRAIVRGPEILVLCLLRYEVRWDMALRRTVETKYNGRIAYDELLDLSEFTSDGESLKYRLDGVISHQGDSTRGGHYISHVREDGRVKEFDDEDTNELPGEVGEALKRPEAFEGNEDFTPYVLVYSKI